MEFLSAGTKKSGHCREVAVSGRSTVLHKICSTRAAKWKKGEGRRGNCFQTTLSHHPKKGCISGQTHFSILWGLWTSISFPYIPIHPILGDPGVDSRGEGKSKQEEKYGTKNTKVFWHQSEARMAATTWNWSGKTLSPGALLAVLCFSSCHIFPPVSTFPCPYYLPWVSEDAFIPPFCNSFKFS